jgi:epimerase transport system membrane fusion protein
VVGLDVTTEGALVEGRKTIMQIVPTANEFMLMTKIKPTDVDQVFIGQKAEIKFTAFRLNFVPVMYGEVLSISADALPDETDRKLYYRARVSIDQSSVETLEKQGWQLVPGMPASVFLKTRERTLLNFIIRPFQLLAMYAFNEDDGIQK